MILIVHQSINIHMIRIDGISNASVFQIGSAGMIKPLAQLMNTGGFTEPAPPAGAQDDSGVAAGTPYVPLVLPSQ